MYIDDNGSVESTHLRKVLSLLDDLNASPQGAHLYQQLRHMLAQFEMTSAETQQVLCAIIGVLLDSLSTHLPHESAILTRLRILRRQLHPPFTEPELHSLRRTVEEAADHVTQHGKLRPDTVEQILRPLLAAYGLSKRDSQWRTSPGFAEETNASSSNIHYLPQINSSDSDARAKPGKLSHTNNHAKMVVDTLIAHEKISEGLERSREFGKYLEAELSNLRHLDDIELFAQKKQAVINELENLLRDHTQMTEYFDRVSKYLHVVKKEGARLTEELTRVTTLSLTDELTGLPNRRAFLKRLKDEISRVQRYGSELALALLDLDRFKPINDTYGHPAGDAVLRAYSQDILSTFRQNDMVARFGGEEFAVVFPNTSVDGAYKALRKVLKHASETSFQHDQLSIGLPTFSAGLVVYKAGETVENFIRRADDALYAAKKAGRNRIEVALPESALAE